MKFLIISIVLMASIGCESLDGGTRMTPEKFFFTKPEQKLASAIAWGRIGTIEKLLEEGVNINCLGKDDITPLIWAVVKKKKKSFEYLLEQGANPNLQVVQGESVMSFAAMMEDSDYLKAALEHGGNPSLVNPETGEPPIFEAIFNFRKENIDLLIKYEADLNFQDSVGKTPLGRAIDFNQYDVAYQIIQAGADIWITNNFGNTVTFSIEQNPASTEHESYKWRAKVIELLRDQGMEVLPWTPEKGPGRVLKKKHPSDFE